MAVGMTVPRFYVLVDAEVYEFLRTQYPQFSAVRLEQSSGSCIYSVRTDRDQPTTEQFQFTVRAVSESRPGEALLVVRTSQPVEDDAEFGRTVLRRFRSWQQSDQLGIAQYRAFDPNKSPEKPPRDAPIEQWLTYRKAVHMATGKRPSYRELEEASKYSQNQFKKYVAAHKPDDPEYES